ncbi:hypothetical protein BDZ94DRAFT_1201291 [Collybia nuda]|uniref:Uncharacterized protein n=1 Tax=Collybia nuda TaxID=64659 RepID=A0A9P6CAE4_9AGAR|nr:hypothetical protein BDZ94DRAFT_1201291 [Collybia nuda]
MNKSAEPGLSGSPRTKPSTRSSIRHSLGLAGKAFVDVINKDVDKGAKKGKDASSRRLSVIGIQPAAPRASMGDAKPTPQAIRRVATPESKTITRRRVSAGVQRSSLDEQTSKPLDHVGVTRSASVRPRNPNTSSALPKYRPKSALLETAKPPSPRAGTRRPLNSSDSEKEDRREQIKGETTRPPMEKVSRPISPLPHRAALKANLSSTVNTTPPSTPVKSKFSTPSSSRPSPSRPTKLAKTATSTSAIHSAIPRPPSSTSSSGSFTPHTPKTPSARNISAIRRSAQEKSSRLSPSLRSTNDSPYVRHSRKNSRDTTPSPTPNAAGNMSHISEGNSEDSETDDVELLLAPVAALGAPTPAMPRIQATRNRKRLPPQTPTRANLLPTRANMSYLSPLPPDQNSSSSSLRPPQERGSKQARGSILSWEQLASEASRTLGEDEIENMLSDIPAPFRPGAISPTPSSGYNDIPESPCLSAMSSPGGYGSISQVLLPDVTPSPAIHNNQRYHMSSSDVPVVDAAIVTLLRLQLASAEQTAKARLEQMQIMEEEIHNLKESRTHEARELTKQVAFMEDQIRVSIDNREQADEERGAYTASLENEVRQVQALRDHAIQEAVAESRECARRERNTALASQRGCWAVICSSYVASSEWASVSQLSQMELETIQGDRQILTILLAELNQLRGMVL